MKINPKNIYRAIRNFLFSQLNKEFLFFLFFLFLSSIFWLMMTLNETYEQEICVPVKLTNVPKNVIITTEIEDTIKATVRDKGYTLAGYLYGDRINPVTINFNTYANKNTGYGMVPQVDILKFLTQRLRASSKISAVKPDRLDFYFSYGTAKVVPVKLEGSIIPDQSYYLARTHISPENVTVYANNKLLDSLKYVLTEAVDIKNFNDTVQCEVKMAHKRGIKVIPDKITLTLYPDILTEEVIEVPIRTINTPEGKVLRTFPSRVKIRFTVGASMFRKVKAEHFLVVVDYNDIAAHPSDKCRLQLRNMPQAVRNARLEIQNIDYIIEQQ